MEKTYAPVTTAQELTEALAKCRAAQEKFATYTQEQVDKIFLAAATAANRMRIPLAKQAVAETGMGVVEDKVIKNHFAAEYIYNAYKDSKTCGVIEEDTAYGIQRIAEPIGVIAAVIPTTNPTSTAIFKTLISLKTRNGIIISPHPRAKGCTIAAARVVLEAAVAAGAPEGIIAWIDKPSLELTNQVMREADLILATGGPGMVKAAYSSGKPALGVGPGNTPAVIDDSADILLAVSSVIHSKTFDNGMICASEQSVVVLDSIYDRVKAEFIKRGCYVLNAEEIDKVRTTILINGALNAKIVGQSAHTIAALAGVDVPETAKILIGEVTSTDLSEAFAHEKLSPVLAMYRASDFTDAMNKADTLVKDGGYGHTASVYLDTVSGKEKLDAFAEKMKACRILVNTPSSHGGIGDLYNFKLAPSLTLGCGSWGGNSVSENVGIKHLLNIKTVAIRRENMLWFRAPEKVYFKKGCLPVALAELKNYKKAFIVTDAFLYQNGYTKPVEEKLDAMGITHTTSYNVAPDPTLACAREGAAQMAAFKPDLILAIGGGSAMDAGKIMWVLYEHPEADFQDMAMRFVDIRKRVYTFPKMGEKAYFVAIPTTAGTGSETTIAAVVTGANHHKYAVSDLCLIPCCAVLDPLLTVSLPPHTTAETGMDALTHAVEAYLGRFYPTRETNRLAEQAVVTIFQTLEHACAHGDDVAARQALLTASYQAGFAFTRAGVGNVHAIAHTLGGLYGVGHGLANAVLLPVVLRDYGPAAHRKLARLAELVGLTGDSEADRANAFIDAISAMERRLGIPTGFTCIREQGLPRMAAWAAAEANPTYPVPVIYDRARFIRVLRQVMQ